MKIPSNIQDASKLEPDYLGFIFHPGSPRYAAGLDPATIPLASHRVGVFVNAPQSDVLARAKEFGLQSIQLHGQESPQTCRSLKKKGYRIIKAFPVEKGADLLQTAAYDDGCCDYFLFDTKTPQHGGSGKRFDWDILNLYRGQTPFWLSGGISPLDADEIRTLKHPKLSGVDLNSRFEIEPGLKNIELLERFIKNIRQ